VERKLREEIDDLNCEYKMWKWMEKNGSKRRKREGKFQLVEAAKETRATARNRPAGDVYARSELRRPVDLLHYEREGEPGGHNGCDNERVLNVRQAN